MNKCVSFMLIFFFMGSFLGTFSSTSTSELVEDSWNIKAPMRQSRGFLGVATVDGKIYAIGCSTARTRQIIFLGTNERYDPKTDMWTTLKSMPTPRSDFSIVVCT
jgi:N-acetylneuraminic acid mutarotase